MKKNITFILVVGLCFSSSLLFGQKFNFSVQTGFAEYEIENNFKTYGYSYGAFFGKDFSISENNRFVVSAQLGATSYFFNYLDIHAKTSFVELPIGVKLQSIDPESKKGIYTSIGLVNRYKLANDFYSNTLQSKIRYRETGYHLGTFAEVAYTSKWGFVGLVFNGDFFQTGYTEDNKINNAILFKLGLHVF